MKTQQELEMLLKLEVAINELHKYINEQLYSTRSESAFERMYSAETLCRALTNIKCSIGCILDD